MLILLLWVLVSAGQDLRSQRIDNRLLYPFLLLAVLWLLINAESLAGVSVIDALAGLGCALALTVPGHIKGVLGGGDVKLMAGIGLTVGAMMTLLVIIIAGLLFVLWAVAAARLPRSAQLFLQRHAQGLSSQQGHIAYGPFIFLALAALYTLIRLY
ncbi:A24 family peptidase [Halomonas sp. MC140]|nr:A24 family peptidase [Halomonas sp. MC140]MDN7130820.1 A24 family peptidase [Halomonas sp. MC140]